MVTNVVVIGAAGMTGARRRRGRAARGSRTPRSTSPRRFRQHRRSHSLGGNTLSSTAPGTPAALPLRAPRQRHRLSGSPSTPRSDRRLGRGGHAQDRRLASSTSAHRRGCGLRLGAPTPAGKSVVANHLTVVGGAATSRDLGRRLATAGSPRRSRRRSATPSSEARTTSLATAVSGSSTATVSVDHRDFQSKTGWRHRDGAGNLARRPGFVDAGDGNYALRVGLRGRRQGRGHHRRPGPTSTAGSAPSTATATARRSPTWAPTSSTTSPPPHDRLTAGPNGPTNDNTPVFTFKQRVRTPPSSASSTAGASRTARAPSPRRRSRTGRTPSRSGPGDEVFNVEANPPKRTFTVDTKAPDTTLTKKPPKRFYKQRVKFKFVVLRAGREVPVHARQPAVAKLPVAVRAHR